MKKTYRNVITDSLKSADVQKFKEPTASAEWSFVALGLSFNFEYTKHPITNETPTIVWVGEVGKESKLLCKIRADQARSFRKDVTTLHEKYIYTNMEMQGFTAGDPVFNKFTQKKYREKYKMVQ